MHSFEIDQLQRFPNWRTVLTAYAQHLEEQRRLHPDQESWVPRLKTVDGVEPVHLAPIHGKLIALGLLQFELSGRDSGVLYQLSPLGRQVLNQAALPNEDAAEEEALAA